jgi:hypothetical protein
MMDMFLSVRLVVDTGMNALGWSRERAMDYMREHTLESEEQIHTETLRYSVDTPAPRPVKWARSSSTPARQAFLGASADQAVTYPVNTQYENSLTVPTVGPRDQRRGYNDWAPKRSGRNLCSRRYSNFRT